MKTILRVGAPYLAVLVCWCAFESAWLTILVYHAQVLLWSRKQIPQLWRGWDRRLFLTMSLPCAAAGPLAYMLLPAMTGNLALHGWLAHHGLTGLAWVLMVPYFGFIHPLLEQVHWARLREKGWPYHLAFSGYHALVLNSLIRPVWLVLCLATLFLMSMVWGRLSSKTNSGLLVPMCGHILADIGMVLAAWRSIA